MVCAVFKDLSTPSGLRSTDSNFESRLFIMLRNQVFNYLKTAAKKELFCQKPVDALADNSLIRS